MGGNTLIIFIAHPTRVIGIKKKRIGVCADWLIGPRVESAWLSANDLAKKIK